MRPHPGNVAVKGSRAWQRARQAKQAPKTAADAGNALMERSKPIRSGGAGAGGGPIMQTGGSMPDPRRAAPTTPDRGNRGTITRRGGRYGADPTRKVNAGGGRGGEPQPAGSTGGNMPDPRGGGTGAPTPKPDRVDGGTPQWRKNIDRRRKMGQAGGGSNTGAAGGAYTN